MLKRQKKISGYLSIVRFVEILEDTLVASRVEVFELAEGADLNKHPKFYFFTIKKLSPGTGSKVGSVLLPNSP